MTSLLTVELDHGLENDGFHSIAVTVLRSGRRELTHRNRFRLLFTPEFRERLRWYFEDFPSNESVPAREWANQIEEELVEFGQSLFQGVFSREAVGIWTLIRHRLDEVRFEVTSNNPTGYVIPWEAMRDPQSGVMLAIASRAFVRVTDHYRTVAFPPPTAPFRILLVISRPLRDRDVPFRAVAKELKSVANQNGMEIDVLRPVTLTQLKIVVDCAALEQRPYHAVHFDGHGVYEDLIAKTSGQPDKAPRGFVLFEHGSNDVQPADGRFLGEMLSNAKIPYLILNACRSAHTVARNEPGDPSDENAFPSFAHEALAAGLLGVIAMRHNVYVDTARVFVRSLYAVLHECRGVGESVGRVRAQLWLSAKERNGIHDWLIPLVYEFRSDRQLVPPIFSRPRSDITQERESSTPAIRVLPNVQNFTMTYELVGQDEAFLAIDRAFDVSSVFALYGDAGIGKTSIAFEFGRWYRETNGISGPVVFTSFADHPEPIALFLAVSKALGIPGWSERHGPSSEWSEMLRAQSFLWIWDGVEHLFSRQSLASQLGAGTNLLRLLVTDFRAGLPVLQYLAPADHTHCILRSLDSGFPSYLSPQEQAVLALVHLYRGIVHLKGLQAILSPRAAQSLKGKYVDVGFNDESMIETILTAASDGGLLTKWSRTNYHPHPALHVYLHRLFSHTFDDPAVPIRGFIVEMIEHTLGTVQQIQNGDHDLIYLIALERSNLLNARAHAIKAELWWEALLLTDFLGTLGHFVNYPVDVSDLYIELKPHFSDATGGPLPEEEWGWATILEAVGRRALQARDYAHAEEVLKKVIERLTLNRGLSDPLSKDLTDTVVHSMALLGEVYIAQRRIEAGPTLEKALALCQELKRDVSLVAITLAKAYMMVPAIRNVARAEQLAILSLSQLDEGGREGKAKALCILGQCRMFAAGRARQTNDETTCSAEAAAARRFLEEAIRISVPSKSDDLVAIHSSLGKVCELLGELDLALAHQQKALKHASRLDDPQSTASARASVAATLGDRGQYGGALSFIEGFSGPESGEAEVGDYARQLLIRDSHRLLDEARYLADYGEEGSGDTSATEAIRDRILQAKEQCDRLAASGVHRDDALVYLTKATVARELILHVLRPGDWPEMARLCEDTIGLLTQGLRTPKPRLRAMMYFERGYFECELGEALQRLSDSEKAIKAHLRAIADLNRAESLYTVPEENEALGFILFKKSQSCLAISRIWAEQGKRSNAIRTYKRASAAAEEYIRVSRKSLAYGMFYEAMLGLADWQAKADLVAAFTTLSKLAEFCDVAEDKLKDNKTLSGHIRIRMGWVQFCLRRWTTAREHYSSALHILESLPKMDAESFADIGHAHRDLSQIPGTPPEKAVDHLRHAIAAFEEAFRLDPKDVDLVSRKAQSIVDLATASRHSMPDEARRLFEEAISLLEEAQSNSPQQHLIVETKARALKQFALFEGVRGRFTEAIPKLKSVVVLIEQLRSLHPKEHQLVHDKAAALVLLGEAYLFTNQVELAREPLQNALADIQEALSSSPKNKQYREIFNEISKHFSPPVTLRDSGI